MWFVKAATMADPDNRFNLKVEEAHQLGQLVPA
jgi:hypothetical protein